MNLEKLFAQQQILKNRIGYNGEDRFEKLVLALLVELGECANEWRGFKFWSKHQEPRNRTLEEYVDGLHFVLELGLDINYKNTEPFNLTDEVAITEIFIKLHYQISSLYQFHVEYGNGCGLYDAYDEILETYLLLGEQLGFTREQIEQAYRDKNAVNHERQNNGY